MNAKDKVIKMANRLDEAGFIVTIMCEKDDRISYIVTSEKKYKALGIDKSFYLIASKDNLTNCWSKNISYRSYSNNYDDIIIEANITYAKMNAIISTLEKVGK